MTESYSHREIIDAYLNYYRTKKEEYWWAYEKVTELVEYPNNLKH